MHIQQTPVVEPPVWDNVPADLAGRQQWLLWKFEFKDEKAEKPGKIPYYVGGGRRTGSQGSERDRMRLATLAVARRAFEKGGWHGVGFGFLPDDGLIGIDIDGAIDLTTGTVSERCAAIIKSCNSFTEYSPSGKGVHIIVRGEETTTNKSNDIGLELFCKSQFFTFTAKRYPDTPATVNTIDPRVLARLHATINEAKNKHRVAATPAPARAPTPPAAGVDHFKACNEMAMRALQAWVPSLFPAATVKGSGFRVTSKALGRDLQEDLSITEEGIVDFGVADMGDPRQGKRTPIDLVLEWLPAPSPKDALQWLAQRVGLDVSPPERRPRKNGAELPAPAEEGNPPGNGGGGASSGGGGPPDDEDDGPVDVFASLHKHRNKPVDCRENVMYCLQLDPELQGIVRQNQFTQIIERGRMTPWGHPPGEWNEEDDLMLGEYLLRTYGLGLKAPSTLRNGVLMAARSAKYNPVHDLIRTERWDGVERLDHWLTDVYEIEERPYTQLIGRCFMMGLVKRAISPGCKFDYMLIIKGEQGLQKSGAFRVIADPFFTDNAIRMGDKDSLMAMQLVWIAESAELESLNKSETTQIKQFLSAQEDLYRPPYGAQLVKRPRHAVNVGTTNADTFLKDATGDRRMWPLEVFTVNLDVLREMRFQLFAEALHRLEAGEQYWPTRQQEKELIFPEQEQFKRGDTWEDILDAYVNRDHLEKNENALLVENAKREFFTTVELYERALLIKADRIDGNGQMDTRIGNAMKALRFERHRETTGKRRRGFRRLPPLPPPVNAAGEPINPIPVVPDDDTPF